MHMVNWVPNSQPFYAHHCYLAAESVHCFLAQNLPDLLEVVNSVYSLRLCIMDENEYIL